MTADWIFLTIVLPMVLVLGETAETNTTTTSYFPADPYLQFQPSFSRSLPIQLLMTGIVFTLCATLAIQLIFTWQYHWSLARVNWTLQFTGVCALLLNIISILFVVLSALEEKSKEWPYMFEYIAVGVPRLNRWPLKVTALWCVMEATTSALASITHIQFLTYLYPSRLEARLVFILLGPLAILASIMTLLPISCFSESNASPSIISEPSSSNSTLPSPGNTSTSILFVSSTNDESAKRRQLLDLFDAARNICNLTLSLLFTLSLLLWGFLINRRNAWRTDGGTAAFGVGALFLALVSTGLNFLNVFIHPRLTWLSSLLWSVVLWQSFLGWWWWVGSASGIAAREIDMDKRERKEQKRRKHKRRKVTETLGKEENASASARSDLENWHSSVGTTFSRRRPVQPAADAGIELTAMGPTRPLSTAPLETHTPWYSFFTSTRHAWCSLRQAHARAARLQAFEQRQIQIQMDLENGRGLGRFLGMGEERERRVSRNESEDSRSNGDGERHSRERGDEDEKYDVKRRRRVDKEVSRKMWWWGPLRNWRLRDSTVY